MISFCFSIACVSAANQSSYEESPTQLPQFAPYDPKKDGTHDSTQLPWYLQSFVGEEFLNWQGRPPRSKL